MTDKYRGGYKKALLDIRNLVEKQEADSFLKGKKQTTTFLRDFITLLLTDYEALDLFMDYGYINARITPDGHVTPLRGSLI